jgi:aryl-alcohol dehydrogenase-like predicted oxidoreductase
MELRPLGRTGLRVSQQCLGAMMFGAWGNPDHAECEQMIHRALDAGINFVDTADVYANGESEEIVGKALKGRRDDVVLATKFWNGMGEGPNQRGGSKTWVHQAVEGSLRRLGTDYIDLYQMHRADADADLDETLGALSDLVHQGKVRYVGSSTHPAETIVEAQWVAERRGRERFVCEQPPYSILQRGIERAVLPTCQRYGMGVIVWSPLASGMLTGKYRRDERAPKGSRLNRSFNKNPDLDERKFAVVDALDVVAASEGLSLTHLALAWTLEHPGVTAAIIGPKTPDQLEDLLQAADVRLSADALDAIDDIVAPGFDLDPAAASAPTPALASAARRRQRQTQ